MIFDDSDVKIFNDNEKETFDEVSIISEMTKNRSNGNSQKAKELGKTLAERFVDEAHLLCDLENEIGEIPRDDNTMYQMKVLLAFSAEYSINRCLFSPLLVNTAVNALYDTVKKKAFEFYDRLDDAAEYSFYYLAVRKGIEISDNIGISFAMLCGKENDEYYKNLGKRLFEVATYETEKIINNAGFVK